MSSVTLRVASRIGSHVCFTRSSGVASSDSSASGSESVTSLSTVLPNHPVSTDAAVMRSPSCCWTCVSTMRSGMSVSDNTACVTAITTINRIARAMRMRRDQRRMLYFFSLSPRGRGPG